MKTNEHAFLGSNWIIHDLTVPVREDMPLWPGNDAFELIFKKSFQKGDAVNVSKISCNSHIGTHVDAPYHYIKDGAAVSDISAVRLMGEAVVFDLVNIQHSIRYEHVKNLKLQNASICLFKTKNSELWDKKQFDPNYVFLTYELCEWLISNKITVVGIDYLSVGPYTSSRHEIHRLLLDKGIIIVEGLNLRHISAGMYFFICLPLLIDGAEAAPARALLIEKKNT